MIAARVWALVTGALLGVAPVGLAHADGGDLIDPVILSRAQGPTVSPPNGSATWPPVVDNSWVLRDASAPAPEWQPRSQTPLPEMILPWQPTPELPGRERSVRPQQTVSWPPTYGGGGASSASPSTPTLAPIVAPAGVPSSAGSSIPINTTPIVPAGVG